MKKPRISKVLSVLDIDPDKKRYNTLLKDYYNISKTVPEPERTKKLNEKTIELEEARELEVKACMLNPSCKYYKLTNGYLKPSILTKSIKKISSRILLLPGTELKPIAFENDKSFAEERYRKLYEQNYGKFNRDVVEKYEKLIEEAYKNKEYRKAPELQRELYKKI